MSLPAGYALCPRCHVVAIRPGCKCCLGCADGVNIPVPAPVEPPPKPPTKQRKGPNKTEQEYNVRYLGGRGQYEAVTLRMKNNHLYTPDWLSIEDSGRMTLTECKGAYRFGSHQRARLAFDQCANEFPGFRWVWATRAKDGHWKVETLATKETP